MCQRGNELIIRRRQENKIVGLGWPRKCDVGDGLMLKS